MPTSNIPDLSKIRTPLYSGHAAVVPMVSALEGFHSYYVGIYIWLWVNNSCTYIVTLSEPAAGWGSDICPSLEEVLVL